MNDSDNTTYGLYAMNIMLINAKMLILSNLFLNQYLLINIAVKNINARVEAIGKFNKYK